MIDHRTGQFSPCWILTVPEAGQDTSYSVDRLGLTVSKDETLVRRSFRILASLSGSDTSSEEMVGVLTAVMGLDFLLAPDRSTNPGMCLHYVPVVIEYVELVSSDQVGVHVVLVQEIWVTDAATFAYNALWLCQVCLAHGVDALL